MIRAAWAAAWVALVMAGAAPSEAAGESGEKPTVASILEQMRARGACTFSARGVLLLEQLDEEGTATGIPQTEQVEMVWSGGRARWVSRSTVPGLDRPLESRFAFAGSYMASFTTRPPGEDPSAREGGYGVVLSAQERRETGAMRATSPRYGLWLFGLDVLQKRPESIHLLDRLAGAPSENLSLAEVPREEGEGVLWRLAAALDDGDYSFDLDPDQDLRMVQMTVHRDRVLHPGLPEGYAYDSMDFRGFSIRYEDVEGRLFPVGCVMETQTATSEEEGLHVAGARMTLEFSEVRWMDRLPAAGLELDWPENTLVADLREESPGVPGGGDGSLGMAEILTPDAAQAAATRLHRASSSPDAQKGVAVEVGMELAVEEEKQAQRRVLMVGLAAGLVVAAVFAGLVLWRRSLVRSGD